MVVGQNLMDRIVTIIIDPLILLIFSVGFVVFLWGLVEFMRDVESESAREKGKQHMLWGLVGMFIMIAVQGILAIALDTFDINPNDMGNDTVINRSGGGGNPFFNVK
ncbi:MAG: hypothetical protein KBE09_01225 [Candidatus Pacebacteria bacterium]|nr:hypothetical protein [Candidatus Paceibacterota bacterium]